MKKSFQLSQIRKIKLNSFLFKITKTHKLKDSNFTAYM